VALLAGFARPGEDALRRQAGYIVIEAPSTSSSADAQSLASLADAAILAVELRRSKRPALLDAAEQLSRVGTKLLGAVVLPKLDGATRTSPADSQPAVALSAQKHEVPPVIDGDRTQPMRALPHFVPRPARQGDGTEEVTAIINLAQKSKQSRDDER